VSIIEYKKCNTKNRLSGKRSKLTRLELREFRQAGQPRIAFLAFGNQAAGRAQYFDRRLFPVVRSPLTLAMKTRKGAETASSEIWHIPFTGGH